MLFQEYEGIKNWDVGVKKMASNWKLMIDGIFGHTQTRLTIRFCVWAPLVNQHKVRFT